VRLGSGEEVFESFMVSEQVWHGDYLALPRLQVDSDTHDRLLLPFFAVLLAAAFRPLGV